MDTQNLNSVNKIDNLGEKIQEKMDLNKWEADPFLLDDTEAGNQVINLIDFGTINTNRFGSVDLKFNLIDGCEVGEYPHSTSESKAMKYFVGHALETMQRSKIPITDLKRFKHIATASAMFAFNQHPELVHDDIRILGSFYFLLGLALYDDCIDDENFGTTENVDQRVKNFTAMSELILRILRLDSFKQDEIQAVEFEERDIILLCFRMYITYITEVNSHYAQLNQHLLKAMEDFFQTLAWFFNRAVSETKKSRMNRKLLSERTYNFMRSRDVATNGCLEYQALAYKVELKEEIRQLPDFIRINDAFTLSTGLLNDLFSVAREYDFEEEFNGTKICHMKNLVFVKLLNDKLNLQEAIKHVEQLYNSEVKDMLYFGNELISKYPEDKNVKQYVFFMRWIVVGTLKTCFGLKHRYGRETGTYMSSLVHSDYTNLFKSEA